MESRGNDLSLNVSINYTSSIYSLKFRDSAACFISNSPKRKTKIYSDSPKEYKRTKTSAICVVVVVIQTNCLVHMISILYYGSGT
jgi:hypothetical protein